MTTADIKLIIKIADDMMHEYSHDELVAMTEEKYYEEVLNRFNKKKYALHLQHP